MLFKKGNDKFVSGNSAHDGKKKILKEKKKIGFVQCVVISIQDNCCFSVGSDNVIKIWRLDNGECVKNLEGDEDRGKRSFHLNINSCR